jgi:hypothetical protein
MSLDYFLLTKTGYNDIMQNLDSIISVYINLKDITNLEFSKSYNSTTYNQMMVNSNKIQHFINVRQEISDYLLVCDENIKLLNIEPDKSK